MTKRVEFKPLKGTVPEGAMPGDTFDLVCTFQVKPSGQVCLTVMGESKMPGYGDTGKPGASYESAAKEMVGAAQPQGY